MIPAPSDAYKYALCMELQSDCFRYTIVDADTKQVSFFKEVEFELYDKESLSELLSEPHFELDYKSISVSISTSRTTLVPTTVFNTSSAKAIFNLNHTEPIDNIDYSRLPALGLVTIYELPLWIKSIFIKRFLRIKVLHQSTVLLKGIFNQPTFKIRAHLLKENGLFYLLITDKGKLTYFNLFNSSEIADLVYYYLFVLDQKEIDQEKIPLHVYGLNPSHEDIREINRLLSHPVEVSTNTEENSNFMLISQLLCV